MECEIEISFDSCCVLFIEVIQQEMSALPEVDRTVHPVATRATDVPLANDASAENSPATANFTVSRANIRTREPTPRPDMDMQEQQHRIEGFRREASIVSNWNGFLNTCVKSGVHRCFLLALVGEAVRYNSVQAELAASQFPKCSGEAEMIRLRAERFQKRLSVLAQDISDTISASEAKYCECLGQIASYHLFQSWQGKFYSFSWVPLGEEA